MKTKNMVFPLLQFWIKSLFTDLFYKYIFQLNLGSLFLISSFISFLISCVYLFVSILPNMTARVFVTAGSASIFSASLITSILLFSLFVLYDYSKK